MPVQPNQLYLYISNAENYCFSVRQDVPVNKDALSELDCIFHNSLEDLQKHAMDAFDLDRDELGSEITIINDEGVLKVSQHAYFCEIDLDTCESINHYIATYSN